ncbi:MAG: QueT transporter family protein [Erysipelotrichaceae bacterium]|nr:QueT transporter family protein [Erysipelotrichaceae bacterium]
MNVRRERLLHMAQGALIAVLYATLTVIFAPISFGPVQVRIAEALTILPMFTLAAIPGLFIGCIIANLFGGAIIWDVIFGTLATLIGAAGGYRLRNNRWLVPIPTIIANGIIVPFVLKYGYGMDMPIILMMFYVSVGEIIGCYVLGEMLASALLKHGKILQKFV